jgi:ribonuclease G
MNKEMIISSGDHDTRVAILEDDQVVEVFIERERSRGVVGNIYKGRVSKVLPGMQSSFIDIGLERDAFLYVSEVVNTVAEFDRLEAGEDEDEDEEQPVPVPSPRERGPSRRNYPRRRTAARASNAAGGIGIRPAPSRATTASATSRKPRSKTC